MPTSKHIRANDQTEFLSGREDFVIRRYGMSQRQLRTLVLGVIVVIIGVAFLVYNNMKLGSLLCVLFGLILLTLAKQIEKRQKLLQSSEFLSALLASGLGAGYRFCLIANQETGHIVYLNHASQDMFPELSDSPSRSLEELCDIASLSESDRSAIMSSVRKNAASQLAVQMKAGEEKKDCSVQLFIEPIARPSGFSLLRGK